MAPTVKVADFEQSAYMHQDQCQGQIGDQTELSKNLYGEEGRQVDQAGKRRTYQQADDQVASDSRDTAERSKPATQQGTDENRGKCNQYLEQKRVHSFISDLPAPFRFDKTSPYPMGQGNHQSGIRYVSPA